MEKTKDNNHYVSKFQLRHFCIKPPPPNRNGRYWVYVFEVGRQVGPVNTTDAGSDYQFYGSDDDRLEDLFGNMESRAGTLYADIARKPELVASHAIKLGDFIWIQSFRTKAIRERMRSGIASATGQLSETVVSDKARAYFRAQLDRRLEAEIEKELSQFNAFQRALLRTNPEFRSRVRQVRAKFERELSRGTIANEMHKGLKGIAQIFETSAAIDAGHNDGLKEFMESGGTCPDRIRPSRWTVVRSDSEQFVLGDATTFGVTEQGKICPLIGMSSDWHEVYLPLNPFLTVVGTKHDGAPSLDAAAIVSSAIATSHKQFFASYSNQELATQTRQIDTMGEFVGEEEMREIVEGVWDRPG